jgi:hypothetical protein
MPGGSVGYGSGPPCGGTMTTLGEPVTGASIRNLDAVGIPMS